MALFESKPTSVLGIVLKAPEQLSEVQLSSKLTREDVAILNKAQPEELTILAKAMYHLSVATKNYEAFNLSLKLLKNATERESASNKPESAYETFKAIFQEMNLENFTQGMTRQNAKEYNIPERQFKAFVNNLDLTSSDTSLPAKTHILPPRP